MRLEIPVSDLLHAMLHTLLNFLDVEVRANREGLERFGLGETLGYELVGEVVYYFGEELIEGHLE